MTDLVKIKISNPEVIKYLWSHPFLYYHSKVEKLVFETSEIRSKETKQYKGIFFELKDKYLYVYFRPHYYYNNNLHNANDFNALNSISILNEFVNTFKLETKDLKIIGLEFGVNIVIPIELISIESFLSRLCYHGKNAFNTDAKYPFCKRSNSINKKGESNTYKIIKAYAKGIQHPKYTDRNTFRFEVKSMRKAMINKLGIYTVDELLKPETYFKLKDEVLKEFDSVLIIDDKNEPNISNRRIKKHKERFNTYYWNELLFKSRNSFKKNFNSYYEDLETCKTHLKKEVKTLINSKLNELLKGAYFTTYKDEIRTLLKKQCLLTGLNIVMQKEDSILLSHTGLKYYYKTDKKIFNEVKNKYLSKRWINSDYETQIKEIAHNIRNKHTNTNNSRKLKYNPMQGQLF